MKTNIRALAGASALALLLVAAPAFAADADASPPAAEEPAKKTPTSHSDADRAIKLSNFIGLSGMRDLIDARVPEGFTVRGGLTTQKSSESLQGDILQLDVDKLSLQAYAGVAFLSLIEAGARLPFEVDHLTRGARSGGHERTSGTLVGNLDVGAKLGITLGPIALAPYCVVSFPTGDAHFDKTSGFDVGGAATATLLDSRLAFHVNVDGSFRDNTQALHYRVGTSVVPIANNVLLLRPFAYLDGRAFIRDGSGGDLRIAAGAQALLFDFLTLQAGFDYRFLDDSEPSKNSTDKGTWALDLGAGVAF